MNIIDAWTTDGTEVEIFLLTISFLRFLFLLRSMKSGNIHT